MAGSFGFEKEKYEISMKVGERNLLPRVRGCPAEILLLADGFSCREQVEQGAGKVPLHVAQVLQLALREKSGVPATMDSPNRVRRGVLMAAMAAAALGVVLLVRAS